MAKFKLTRNQIDTSIKLGLIRSRGVKNPHYLSGPPATLVSEEDVEAHLDETRKLPRFSEEEKGRQRIYLERKSWEINWNSTAHVASRI